MNRIRYRIQKAPRIRREMYWACATEKITGRPVVLGPFPSEVEASQFGFERIKDGEFTVYPFRTVNRIMARDMFKAKMLEKTGQLADVFNRAKYKVEG